MFAARYFAPTYFAPTYFPQVGATAAEAAVADLVFPIHLFEAVAHNGSALVNLRYSSDEFTPSDIPGEFDVVLIEPPEFTRNLWGVGRTLGRSDIGFGSVQVVNTGDQDALIDYGFDGRSFVSKIVERSGDYADAIVVMTGVLEQPEFTFSRLILKLRDRISELNRPVQTAKYGGTNALPNGVDGTADDIKGKPIILTYGQVRNVEPILVNTARQVYQLHQYRIEEITAVRDKGVALAAGTTHSTLAALMSATVTPGTYDSYLGSASDGAYFRIGASSSGTITADIKGDKADGTYRYRVGDLISYIANTRGGIASADIDSDDVAALNVANGAVVGITIIEETVIADVLDRLAMSIGASWGFDRLGLLGMRRLSAPTSRSRTLRKFGLGVDAQGTDIDVIDVQRISSNDPGNGVPVWSVKLRYARNWTPQNATDLAASVSDADRAFYQEEWREIVSSNSAILTKHPQAVQLEVETLLYSATDAQAEADRILALYGTRRDRLRARVQLTADLVSNVDLATELLLVLDRFDYSAGKDVAVTGIRYAQGQLKADLDLWG